MRVYGPPGRFSERLRNADTRAFAEKYNGGRRLAGLLTQNYLKHFSGIRAVIVEGAKCRLRKAGIMSAERPPPILRFIRKLTGARTIATGTDAQLLSRFVAQRDEAAFTALVERHGHVVYGVCRRVLQDSHDAENAYQATFLVLAQKAGSIGHPEILGNRLYGVAYRTAMKAKARARGRAQELPTFVRLTSGSPWMS